MHIWHYFSAMYISPYENAITLSEAVLQLSGSYGVYNMGFSVSQLVTFFMKLLPVFLMEMYGGTIFYRHFCIASIFVFQDKLTGGYGIVGNAFYWELSVYVL